MTIIIRLKQLQLFANNAVNKLSDSFLVVDNGHANSQACMTSVLCCPQLQCALFCGRFSRKIGYRRLRATHQSSGELFLHFRHEMAHLFFLARKGVRKDKLDMSFTNMATFSLGF